MNRRRRDWSSAARAEAEVSSLSSALCSHSAKRHSSQLPLFSSKPHFIPIQWSQQSEVTFSFASQVLMAAFYVHVILVIIPFPPLLHSSLPPQESMNSCTLALKIGKDIEVCYFYFPLKGDCTCKVELVVFPSTSDGVCLCTQKEMWNCGFQVEVFPLCSKTRASVFFFIYIFSLTCAHLIMLGAKQVCMIVASSSSK